MGSARRKRTRLICEHVPEKLVIDGKHGRCGCNHRNHIVIDGSKTQSRDEDVRTELASTVTALLPGFPVTTHSSDLSVLPTMHDQCCGLMSIRILALPNDQLFSQLIFRGSYASDFLY